MAEHPMAAGSDAVWALGFSESERLACSYPGEPTGVYVRRPLNDKSVVSREDARRLIIETVARCDACYGYCTVPPALKLDRAEPLNANAINRRPAT